MADTDRPTEQRDPFIGRVIDGRFTIEGVLGRGGMGVVYRAHQASLERSVALKLMTGVPPERADEFQRRFFLEAATAAKLKHPNTITVFDYGSSVVEGENLFYITMELLDGVTLAKLLAQGRALAPLRATHIALQICRSLREAHVAGVVHRDLKPGNVMIVKQDEADDPEADFVKVLDFGLAKTRAGEGGRPLEGITKVGTFMGSPRYVAPEQIEGRAVDHRADIYSLGCLLFRMLAGRAPYDGQQPTEIMLKHLREPVPALGVAGMPLTLERLVTDCLAKDAAARPARMDDVIQRLRVARTELGGAGSGVILVAGDRPRTEDARAAGEYRAPESMRPALASRVEGASRAEHAPRVARADVDAPRDRAVDPDAAAQPKHDALLVAAPTVLDAGPFGWKPGEPALGDDSTRPTRVLPTLRPPPAARPWAAVVSGVAIGLVLCAGLVSWRLGLLNDVSARLVSAVPLHTLSAVQPASVETRGAFAAHAQLRIVTTPSGADVLEVVDGLPRLIGITPLAVAWDVGSSPKARELTLRKEGHEPVRLTVQPPVRSASEPNEQPVPVDVSATLRLSVPVLSVEAPPSSVAADVPGTRLVDTPPNDASSAEQSPAESLPAGPAPVSPPPAETGPQASPP